MREKEGYRDLLEALNEAYPGKLTLTVKEAANVLGISMYTLYDNLKSPYPDFPSSKVGGKIMIAKTVIANHLLTRR